MPVLCFFLGCAMYFSRRPVGLWQCFLLDVVSLASNTNKKRSRTPAETICPVKPKQAAAQKGPRMTVRPPNTPCRILGPTGMVGGVETSRHTRPPSLNYAGSTVPPGVMHSLTHIHPTQGTTRYCLRSAPPFTVQPQAGACRQGPHITSITSTTATRSPVTTTITITITIAERWWHPPGLKLLQNITVQ